MLVSPTEPALIRALGEVSGVPERYGVDILFAQSRWGLVGVQRKAFSDLLQSASNGVLAREADKMKQLNLSMLVVEGWGRWTFDGHLVDGEGRGSHWTLQAVRGLLWSVQAEVGCLLTRTETTADTVAMVEQFAAWVAKEKHTSLKRREPVEKNSYGVVGTAAWDRRVLQSMEGLGPAVADAILEEFGGLPVAWTITEEELAGVKVGGRRRIGPKNAARWYRALRSRDGVEGDTGPA